MIRDQRVIRATVGPKVLSRAMDLFDQRADTIFSELLQNARRAQAKNVAISLDNLGELDGKPRCQVVFVDDGEGVADPATLIAFGGSDWDRELDQRENAAGMGFFSLATLGASVRSRDWETSISPDGFAGREEIPVFDREVVRGTTIRFILSTSLDSAITSINSQACYCPMAVTVNGTRIPQQPFLHGALSVKDALGVRIGIYRSTSWFAGRPDRAKDYRIALVNFHGRTVVDPSTSCLPVVEEATTTLWYVKVDVVDAPALKLVLPTRSGIIDNDGWKGIVAAAELALYEAIAQRADHCLPFTAFNRARSLGVQIALPRALPLRGWHISARNESSSWGNPDVVLHLDARSEKPPTGFAILPQGLADSVDAALGEAMEDHAHLITTKFVASCAEYRGYKAYDQIEEAQLRYDVCVNGKTVTGEIGATESLDDSRDLASLMVAESDFTLAERLALILCTKTDEVRLPCVALATNDDRYWGGLTGFVLAAASASEAARSLMEQSWYHDDDDEDDSEEEAHRHLVHELRLLLESSDVAIAKNIADIAFRHLWHYLQISDGAERKVASIDIQAARLPDRPTVVVRFEDGSVVRVPDA